jgi:imidazolonepropionase-like amidohydrolase
MLGMEGKIGTLMPGSFADILLMTHNPLEDVTIFDRYDDTQLAVLKEGRVMKSKLDHLEAEVSLA